MFRILSKVFNINEIQARKYSSGSFWMSLEKIGRLAVNLIVGIWIARYLGPSDYGLLNYGIAFVTILFPIVHFGLQGILVKELYQNPKHTYSILGTSFMFKAIISILVFFVFITLTWFNFFSVQEEKWVMIFVSFSILFQPFLVLECWYEAQVDLKRVSLFKGVFFVILSGIKIIMIYQERSVETFALLFSFEFLFMAIALLVAYYFSGEKVLKWQFNQNLLKNLVSKSWLLTLSSISAIVYLKIDQVMLGQMTSDIELGVYSAAVKLSESWYFVPVILSNSLFPAILEAKKGSLKNYMSRLQQLSNLFFTLAFFLALMVTLIAPFLINSLFGSDYSSAIDILRLHIWAAIFIFLRAIFSKWLIAENMYKFSLISQLSGALVNVILNLVLIPIYGGYGAAIATLFSYATTSLLILGLFKSTRDLFFVFLKSFLAPFKFVSFYERLFKKN